MFAQNPCNRYDDRNEWQGNRAKDDEDQLGCGECIGLLIFQLTAGLLHRRIGRCLAVEVNPGGVALTPTSTETGGTLTLEAIVSFTAVATIGTGPTGAMVYQRAILAAETRRTQAQVVVVSIHTSAAISTWLHQAIVHILLAQFAHKSRHTKTPKRIDLVHAGSTVQTWV